MPQRPSPKVYARGLMWFRRDLRAHDNAALSQALRQCAEVHAVFVSSGHPRDRKSVV